MLHFPYYVLWQTRKWFTTITSVTFPILRFVANKKMIYNHNQCYIFYTTFCGKQDELLAMLSIRLWAFVFFCAMTIPSLFEPCFRFVCELLGWFGATSFRLEAKPLLLQFFLLADDHRLRGWQRVHLTDVQLLIKVIKYTSSVASIENTWPQRS